jgi:hypothetical protein
MLFTRARQYIECAAYALLEHSLIKAGDVDADKEPISLRNRSDCDVRGLLYR